MSTPQDPFKLHSLSTALPEPSLRRPPSLLDLPSEIILLILQHLESVGTYSFNPLRPAWDGRPRRGSARQTDPRHTAREPTALATLSTVNRRLYEWSAPLLWQSVNLRCHSCESLLFFLQEVLPRHVEHIKIVTFGDPHVPSFASHPSFATATKAEIMNAAREVKFDIEYPDKWWRRAQTVQDIFLARILEKLSSVSAIKIEALYQGPSNSQTRCPDRFKQTLALLATLPRLAALQSLALGPYEHPQRSSEIEHLLAILARCRSLQSLELNFPSSHAGAYAFPRFLSSVAQLSSLRRCVLGNPPPRLLALAAPTLSSTLERLHIRITSVPSPVFLPALPSLQYLAITGPGAPQSLTSPATTLGFPALKHLVLDWPMSAAVLALFQSCPVSHLHLKNCATSVVLLLPTLSRFDHLTYLGFGELQPASLAAREDVELREWAEMAGVTVRVKGKPLGGT